MADVQSMVGNLLGAGSTFLPSKWLVHSGMRSTLVSTTSSSSTLVHRIYPNPICIEPTPVESKGVVRTCVGQYMDCNGLCHPIDLEIDDVYWVPWSPMKVLETPALGGQNIHLFTVPRGNELRMASLIKHHMSMGSLCKQRTGQAV